MYQHLVIHQKRRHAKPCCIANTKKSSNRERQLHRFHIALLSGHMLNQVERKQPDQVNSQHLGLEGTTKVRSVGDLFPVRTAKFPTAIDRRSSHQVPDVCNHLDVRLPPLCQTVRDMIKKPFADICSR